LKLSITPTTIFFSSTTIFNLNSKNSKRREEENAYGMVDIVGANTPI